MSRVQSLDKNPLSRPRTAEDDGPKANAQAPPKMEVNGQQMPNLGQTMSTAHDHQPFTEQELALALQRSHLAVPAQG